MEVHAHSHTADPDPSTGSGHRGRKKWTHYLWEFIMLFLAVFCGFLAEYQLEHMIEKQREKQLVKSLVNDLIADTLRLDAIITARNEREWMFDSLSILLNYDPPIDSTNNIYYYAIFIPRGTSIRFTPTDGTLQQLKNSGGLRLISKRLVADSISRYDVEIRSLLLQQEGEVAIFEAYRTIAHRFFNARIFDNMLNANNSPSPPTSNPALISFTQNDLNEFNYKLFSVKALNKANRRDEKRLLMQAKNLLALLQKEYHLSERNLQGSPL